MKRRGTSSLPLPLAVTLILMFTFSNSKTEARIYGGQLYGTICTRVAIMSTFSDCKIQLETDLGHRADENGQVSHLAYCCALSVLRSCIRSKIHANCGFQVDDETWKVLNNLLNGTNYVNGDKLPCEGNEFYYRQGSPLCWPFWGHVIAAVVLVLLLCGSCLFCSKRNQDIVV